MAKIRKSAAVDRVADRLQGMVRRLPQQKKTIHALLIRLDRVANQLDRQEKAPVRKK